MQKVARPLNQSLVKPAPAVCEAPTKSMRPQGYESGRAALSPKAQPKASPKAPKTSAADALRHQQACTSANVSVGRNEYLMERGGIMRAPRAALRAPELARNRDLACNQHVSPDTAILLASLSKQAVTPDERSYETGQAEIHKDAADAIATAKTVGTVMDVAGSAAELVLPGWVGGARSVVGRCAEEYFTGDGHCSLEDMAQAGLMNYAGDTAKKAGGQTFAHIFPGAAGKLESGLAKRGLKLGGGEP